MRALIVVFLVLSVGITVAAGQTSPPTKTPSSSAKQGATLRTPWGAPDLQGVWNSGTVTPLERPKELAGKEFLTAQETASYEREAAEAAGRDRPPVQGDPGTYNRFWFDQGTKVVGTRRTSLIIDPPDGRIPSYTPEAQKRVDANLRRWQRPASSYLDRDTGERCITDGLPITPLQSYNLNFQIFQTPEYVAILAEMFHEHRIIPLDGRAHGTVPQWLGDGRGRWEGDTLVVDTTRFTDGRKYIWAWPWRTPTPTFHLVERFKRVDAQTIDYQFTIEDPSLFTRPFTAAVPLAKTQGKIYEYACHEGNYGLHDILNAPSESAATRRTAPR